MSVKIRLQRHGKKGKPFYHIVAADARAKRDGRFIEKLGTYNPNVNPAVINLDNERALYWITVGAQPTDTARAILKYKGVMYKNHLDKGVAKGAFSQEEADKRYTAWLSEKDAKIRSKVSTLATDSSKAEADRLAKEKAISDARAQEIAAANSELVEEAAAEVEATEEVAEEAP
ncbi:MAG: 30S ribosomal protein S16, partial [Flavobacteriales bacterium]|nr:30S ribosomal protein S16 [Flavobacteriales bacterium]